MAAGYWTSLPEMLCGHIAADKNERSDCWNGTGKGSYSSPANRGNAMEENPTPSVIKAIEKLKSIEKMIEEYSNAATYGDEINIVTTDDEDDDESGSGSGEGSASSGSGTNEIPIGTDPPTTVPINGVGNPDDDENMMGGGVGESPQKGSRNSASQTVLGACLFCSAILLLCSSLVP